MVSSLPPLGPALFGKVRTLKEVMNKLFVGRSEEIEAVIATLFSVENLLLVAPPGTAKTTLIRTFGKLVKARVFTRTATEFDLREDYFGYIDIEALVRRKELRFIGNSIKNSEIVFIDEIFRSSAAVRNLLLEVLAKRTVDGERTRCIAFYSAANKVSHEEEDAAFLDRFLKNFHSYVIDEYVQELIERGVELRVLEVIEQFEIDGIKPSIEEISHVMTIDEVKSVIAYVLSKAREIARDDRFIMAVRRLRELLRVSNIALSDRTLVRIPAVIAAYTLISEISDPVAQLIRVAPMFAKDEREAKEVEKLAMEVVRDFFKDELAECEAIIVSLRNFLSLAEEAINAFSRGEITVGTISNLRASGEVLLKRAKVLLSSLARSEYYFFRKDLEEAINAVREAIRALDSTIRKAKPTRR